MRSKNNSPRCAYLLRMRTALIVFHRWLALATSLFILTLALTGSALVFEGALDRGLNPQLWRVTPAAQPLSLDTLTARALAVAPRPLTIITPGRTADRAFQAQAGQTQIFLDPYTGRLLGTREQADFNRGLPRRLHVLHTSFLVKNVGGAIVGIVTVAALLLVITGIVIWWRDTLWRIRPRHREARRYAAHATAEAAARPCAFRRIARRADAVASSSTVIAARSSSPRAHATRRRGGRSTT